MKYNLFGIKTNMYVSSSGLKFIFESYKDKVLESIAKKFGFDYIKFKHFLIDGEKTSMTEKINARLQSNVFKDIIEKYQGDVFKQVIYSTGSVVALSKDRKYNFVINNKKLVLIVN